MPLNVVFVDDEEDIRDFYHLLFESEDISVSTFADCDELKSYIATSPQIDLLFIDFRMPDCNGVECVQKLNLPCPCYLVSGELDLKCPDGFLGTINKPVKKQIVFDIFQDLLKKHAC